MPECTTGNFVSTALSRAAMLSFALLATLAAPALSDSVAAAEAALTAAKLIPGERDYSGAKARASGLDPTTLATHLDALMAACVTPGGVCSPLITHADLAERLAYALGELGGPTHAPTLLRADQRGSFPADQALDRMRMRLMVDALPTARCAPPTVDELARTSTELGDFLVVRVRAGVLTAEPLQPHERDDLAYFLAAVAQAGREVGAPAEATRSNPGQPGQPGTPAPARTDALTQLQTASAAGDLPLAIAAGRRYLATFGYPRPLDSSADAELAWGGARHSFVMRDVAALAEITGELPLAYDLYRRADPGGGACGTSYWSYWKHQVGGIIRSAERLGDCRPALAERLLDIDLADGSSTEPPSPLGLGTGRLVAAGFDVPRLYRGALLTLGRDDEPALRRALEAAPTASTALARLARRGKEDWARRIRAIEGLAATGTIDTLARLAAMLPTLTSGEQAIVASAIGEAAQRPELDPCAPQDSFGFGSMSSQWRRTVPMLGRTCARSLTLTQSEALARPLLPLATHPDEQIASAAIEALGKLAVTSARPTLRKLARRKPKAPCTDEPSCAVHRRHDTAVQALETASQAVRDAAWHKYDDKRGG